MLFHKFIDINDKNSLLLYDCLAKPDKNIFIKCIYNSILKNIMTRLLINEWSSDMNLTLLLLS